MRLAARGSDSRSNAVPGALAGRSWSAACALADKVDQQIPGLPYSLQPLARGGVTVAVGAEAAADFSEAPRATARTPVVDPIPNAAYAS